MNEFPDEFWWGLAIAASAVLILMWIKRRIGEVWRNYKLRRRFKHARKGEVRAEQVLRRAGLTPIKEQACESWTVLVNGEEEIITLYADWLVEDGDRRYVVEVKTGRLAPSVRNSATRRQLLEYSCAFDVDGVILLDMESEEIQVVEFSMPRRSE